MSEERIRNGTESSINLLRILCKRILDDSSASIPRRLSKKDESVDRLYLQLSHNELSEADNASISKTEPSVIWSAVLHFIITHIPAPLSSNLTDRDSESLITIAAMSAAFKKSPSYLQRIYASLLCTIEIIVSEYENTYKDMVETLCLIFLGHKFSSPRMNPRNHPYILLNIMQEYRNYFSYTSIFSRKVGGIPTCDVNEWKRALSIEIETSSKSNDKEEEEDDYLEPVLSSPQRAPLDPTTKAYPSPGQALMGLDAYLAGMTPNKSNTGSSNDDDSKSGMKMREGECERSLADNTLSAPSISGTGTASTGGGMGGNLGWENLTDDDTSALINLRNNDYIDYDEDEDDSVNSDEYARMRSPPQRGLTGMQRRKMERMLKASSGNSMRADQSESGKKVKRKKRKGKKKSKSKEKIHGGLSVHGQSADRDKTEKGNTGILRRLRAGAEAKGATGSNVRFASQLEQFQDHSVSDSTRVEAKAAGMGVYTESPTSIEVHSAHNGGDVGALEDDSGSDDDSGSGDDSGSNEGSDSGDELTSTHMSPSNRSYYAQLRQARGMPIQVVSTVVTSPSGVTGGLGGSMTLEDDSDDSDESNPRMKEAQKTQGDADNTRFAGDDGQNHIARKLAGKHVLGSIEDDEDEDTDKSASSHGRDTTGDKGKKDSPDVDSRRKGRLPDPYGGGRLSAVSIPRKADKKRQTSEEDSTNHTPEKSNEKGIVQAGSTSVNTIPPPFANPSSTTGDGENKVSLVKQQDTSTITQTFPSKDIQVGATSGVTSEGVDSTPVSRREEIRQKYLSGSAGSNVSNRRSGTRGTMSADKANSLASTSSSNVRSSRALSRQLVFGDDDEDLNLELYTTKSKQSKAKTTTISSTMSAKGHDDGVESIAAVDLENPAEDDLAVLDLTDMDDVVASPVAGSISPVGGDSTESGGRSRSRSTYMRNALNDLQSAEVFDRLRGNNTLVNKGDAISENKSSSASSDSSSMEDSKTIKDSNGDNDRTIVKSQDINSVHRQSKSKPNLARVSKEIHERSKDKEKMEKHSGVSSSVDLGKSKGKANRSRSPIVRPDAATSTARESKHESSRIDKRSISVERDKKHMKDSKESRKEKKGLRESMKGKPAVVKKRPMGDRDNTESEKVLSSEAVKGVATGERKTQSRSPKYSTRTATTTSIGGGKEDVKNGSTSAAVRRSRATRKNIGKSVSTSQEITLPPPPPSKSVVEDLQDATTAVLYTALDSFPNVFTTHTRLPILSPYARQTGVIIEGRLDKKSAHGLGMWATTYWVLAEDPVDFVVLKRFKRSLSTAYGDVPQEQMMRLPVSMIEGVYARIERDARADTREFIVNVSTVQTQRSSHPPTRRKKSGDDSDDDYSIPSVDSKQSHVFGQQQNIQMVMRAQDGEERQLWTTFISLCRNFVLDMQD